MKNYPIALIAAYRDGTISRQQFITDFSNWQKSNGINFDCKGTADRSGTYLTYRGITATLKNGVLHWGKNKTASTLFNLERQIDYALNAEAQAVINACYFTDKAYDANSAANYEAREEYLKKADYFIKQAEKWGALWT